MLKTRGRTKSKGYGRRLAGWLGAGLPILLVCALLSGAAGTLLGAYLSFSAGLPKIPDLRAYRPKTVSTFYAEDGTVTGIFYREKRFPISIESIPDHVIKAFLGAEDTRFFSHTGVDFIGVLRAAIENIKQRDFKQGASTITQQVTRNFLLSREKKISRKIREALLSFRMEKSLSKKEILELYLNEIYLGRGAYGVESAARTYFGTNAQGLTIAEAALLAGLVANPSKFSPFRNLQECLERRNRVLNAMLKAKFISRAQYDKACANVPKFRENLPNPYKRAPYFTEAVRQYIAEKYGEDRLYNEGLQVWTTCDLQLQDKAGEALRDGVRKWEKRRRRPIGLVKRLKPKEAEAILATARKGPYKVGDIVKAVIISNDTPKRKKKKKRKRGEEKEKQVQECTVAIPGNHQFKMTFEGKFRYRPRDLVELRVTAIEGKSLSVELQPLPPVQGAVVCMENSTGYVKALVGGLDFDRSRFNRAVQAKRQPGSSFKPFVYAAALEWSHYSPKTVIVDEPIAVLIDTVQDQWMPFNSDGRFLGPITMKQALIHSRNTSSVKLLMDVGVDAAIRMARRMGIDSPLGKHLSLSLGVSEVTPLELTAAYSVFPNMGVRVRPVLVKKVMDRYGNVLEDNETEELELSRESLVRATEDGWFPKPMLSVTGPQREWDLPERRVQELERTIQREPGRDAAGESSGWEIVEDDEDTVGSDEPQSLSPALEALLAGRALARQGKVTRRPPNERVMSPQTAYLMLSMLKDVCVSGTAGKARKLKRKDIAGKTGTTDDCTDAWFIGFNPHYTTGVWVGYDTKVPLGRKEYGNVAALPVWMDVMKELLKDRPAFQYPIPPGIVWTNPTPQPTGYGWHGYYGQQYAQPARPGGGGPDLTPRARTKPMSPVDSMASSYVDPNTGQTIQQHHGYGAYWGGQSAYGGPSAGYYGGSMRVLSPTGQTLGHAPYYVDEEGKITVSPENSQYSYSSPGQFSPQGTPYFPHQSRSGHQNYPPPSRGFFQQAPATTPPDPDLESY